jgi:hypothetical protein
LSLKEFSILYRTAPTYKVITREEKKKTSHPTPTIKRIKMKIYPIKITFSFSENGSFYFPGMMLCVLFLRGKRYNVAGINVNHFEG